MDEDPLPADGDRHPAHACIDCQLNLHGRSLARTAVSKGRPLQARKGCRRRFRHCREDVCSPSRWSRDFSNRSSLLRRLRSDRQSRQSPRIYPCSFKETAMPGKRRKRTGWVMESVLIALCLAVFGVLYWIAAG